MSGADEEVCAATYSASASKALPHEELELDESKELESAGWGDCQREEESTGK